MCIMHTYYYLIKICIYIVHVNDCKLIKSKHPAVEYISRLMVVSREAKKEQSESPKTKRVTNYCVSFTRANVFVI